MPYRNKIGNILLFRMIWQLRVILGLLLLLLSLELCGVYYIWVDFLEHTRALFYHCAHIFNFCILVHSSRSNTQSMQAIQTSHLCLVGQMQLCHQYPEGFPPLLR